MSEHPTTDPFEAHRPSPETLELLHRSGAILVPLVGTIPRLLAQGRKAKDPFTKGWQRNRETPYWLSNHVSKGGLIGLVPASLNLIALDIDIPESEKAPNSPPHQTAKDVLELMGILFGIEPVLSVGTHSGGIHAFYRCPKGTLPETQREGDWALPIPTERPLIPNGQIRYRKSQVVLWDGGKALADVVRRQKESPIEYPILTDTMIADIPFHVVHNRHQEFGNAFFAPIGIDDLVREKTWIRMVDSIESRGEIHGLFKTAIGSLFLHRAHSPTIMKRVRAKYEECLRERGPSRKYDPDELYRIGVWAIGKAVETAEERFRGEPDFDEAVRYRIEWQLYDKKFDGEAHYRNGTGYVKQSDGTPLLDTLRASNGR